MNSVFNNVFAGLGSNLGDRKKNVRNACEMIGQLNGTTITRFSSMIETEPWGKTDQPFFLNCVIQIETSLTPEELLVHFIAIEKKMGRTRQEKWGPRMIDIDIIFFNDAAIREEHLQIPHPHMAQRIFVLAGMCELDPHKIHPVIGKSMLNLMEECVDGSKIFPVRKTEFHS
ncbi:MAG: 2-amino-4-hydroxy-6-hydroxymethyldihydropteridine diphosphokinase [Bacteroidetes bacterium]|nr:2-amino-4-hydroxy-6-hydroxymethyldihydropteridine diphosphokinase [Bacteroidota bacterium]